MVELMKIAPYRIDAEHEADAYLRDLLANPEYRSMNEVEIRAQKYIAHDARLRTYFIAKAREALIG